jgi:hypothetical protein
MEALAAAKDLSHGQRKGLLPKVQWRHFLLLAEEGKVS